MTIDIGRFEGSKRIVLNYFAGAGGKNISHTVSMGAQITGVPCIVIAFWLGEHLGWSTEILTTIGRLKRFYGYTSILGIPEGGPV